MNPIFVQITKELSSKTLRKTIALLASKFKIKIVKAKIIYKNNKSKNTFKKYK